MTNMMRMTDAQLAEFRAKRGMNRTNAVGPTPAAAQPMLPVVAAKRANKYGNRRTEVDGITFDSRAEAARWLDLKALEKAGLITQLQRQVRYELVPKGKDSEGKAVRAVAYVADFVYLDKGKTVVEDVKGMSTPVYRLKARLMKHVHGVEIREVHK